MPRILAEKGPDRGRSWSVKSDGAFLVGRDTAAQISLRDEEISRRHCQIEFKDSCWWIRDLESTNGIQINGETIADRVRLKHNDHIDLGLTRLTFLVEEDPLIGKTLGGCKVLARIGRGGMGTVYSARQISLDRPVALKVLSDKYTRDPAFIDLFIREARAAGLLSHPHIVQVYDVGREDDLHYFTMELMDHGSAEKRIDENGALPLDIALDIVRQAAKGLEYAEKQGIVHRDIKPGNLMMSQDGTVKIGDLGIARKADASGVVSQKEGVSGSPHYIAPEQARGEAIDQRADIYSLGATLFHCLTGKTPYKGKGARDVILKHMNATAAPDPWAWTSRSQIPLDVRALIQRMMAPKPDDRPVNAEKLGHDLDHLISRYPAGKSAIPVGSIVAGVLIFISIGGWALTWIPDRDLPPKPDPLEQIESTAMNLSQILGAIEERISPEVDLAQVRSDLENFEVDLRGWESREISGSDALLSPLRDRYREVVKAVEKESSRRKELQREAQARELFADLTRETESTKSPAERMPALQALITDFPDTRAAFRATRLIEDLQMEIRIQTQRNQAAERDWNRIRPRAEGWLQSNQPARARQEVTAYPEEHRNTPSWDARDQFLAQIDQQAIDLWRETGPLIREKLQEGRKAEAKDLFQGLVLRASIPATGPFETELLTAIETAEMDSGDSGYASLAPVLKRTWDLWNLQFRGLEAARELRAMLLEERFSNADLELAEKHLQLLQQFDRTLDRQTEVSLPRNKSRVIATADKQISAPWVTLRSDRVIYRDTSEGPGRYLLWKELTPGGRLDLWQEAELDAEWAKLLALLLEFNGRSTEADQIWKNESDKSLRLLLEDLQRETGEEKE
ncbi:MAG: protein kinase domain-containing protein [Planctomycetota bacterium]